ncbi:hypothetical protein LSUB1_G006129 [Lachnellula subtilissima]|uniref:WKF domain-containing protein n=1 Tax=Lachnellula subtilissima TaxID=602034 RepID=A0A8H8U810_9HELO|nr:hypothetical protein LSUB1_G006129 [Lachnellula subtilissima]
MPSATDSSATVRMPAWKRLGLKLKSAQDIPEPPAADTKRKRLDEVEEASSLKKPKLLPDSRRIPIVDQVTPEPTRKKSVTFTPETKHEDGDSIKALFSAWVAEHKNQDDLSAPVFQTPQYTTVEESFDTTLNEKERRVKRVKTTQGKTESQEPPKATDSKKVKKKKKQTDHLTAPSAPTKQAEESLKSIEQSKLTKARKPRTAKGPSDPALPEKPFLAYLKQYSESKETWKFNKNHQSHLLKHLFNIDVIPSSYAHYVYEYVKGLQGGVRTRLRDTALAIKVKDQEEPFPTDMENAEQRKRDYDVAMNEYVATMVAAEVGPDVGYEEGVLLGLSDIAMPMRIAKRKRVERILVILGSGEGEITGTSDKEVVIGDDESQKRLRTNDGSSQKVVRKRKQRTMVADDESTSEEDSSDSDESSSDESTTQNGNAEDSSSSSSSSSSGSEESDSEDGSEESEGDHE